MSLLSFFFPPSCLHCNRSGLLICTKCRSLIRIQDLQSCYLCGKTSDNPGETCQEHIVDRQLDGLLIAAHYDGNPLLKETIHALKYEGKRADIPEALATLFKEAFPFLEQSRDLVMPIPIHEERRKTRGYNQCEEILFALSQQLPQLKTNTKLLTRSKHSESQVNVASRTQRQKNLTDAFKLSVELPHHRRIILLDDVCTTGSTLEEACKTLKHAGAKEVWGLVLARN